MQNESTINFGSLYDVNQQLIKQLPCYSNKKLRQVLDEVVRPYFEKQQATYYMLLCNDNHDYTVFCLRSDEAIEEASKAVYDCIKNRGKAISINEADDKFALEIWIRTLTCDGALDSCYHLFPYDEAIIEV